MNLTPWQQKLTKRRYQEGKVNLSNRSRFIKQLTLDPVTDQEMK